MRVIEIDLGLIKKLNALISLQICQLFLTFCFVQSYGGFLSSFVLSTQESRVFQSGVAVAPVTDWRYYGVCL